MMVYSESLLTKRANVRSLCGRAAQAIHIDIHTSEGCAFGAFDHRARHHLPRAMLMLSGTAIVFAVMTTAFDLPLAFAA